MNSVVKIEPPLIRKEVVQCKRCQRYGHTQKYCNHNFRCVKCTGTYLTDQCTKSSKIPVKCLHCQGDHPANYKGCSAYKTLYINKYPKLRAKETINQTPSPPKFTTTSISSVQVVQRNQNNLKIGTIPKIVFPIYKIQTVNSTNRGETQSRRYTSTGVVNSRYDSTNRGRE